MAINLIIFLREKSFSYIKMKEKIIIVVKIIVLLWYSNIKDNSKTVNDFEKNFFFLNKFFSKINNRIINIKHVLDEPEDLGESLPRQSLFDF